MALRLGIACIALLGLAACGGGDDDGPVIVRDGGTDAGGGGGNDAGGGTDAGSTTTTCGEIPAEGFSALPASCGRRCRNATIMQAQMCPEEDPDCFSNTLDMDPTPPGFVAVTGVAQDPIEIDCSGCYNWQINSCIYDTCTETFEAWATCVGMAANPETDCATQDEALGACIEEEANLMAIQMCAQTRVPVCFGATAGAGFAPEFGQRAFPAPSRSAILSATRDAVSFTAAH